MPAKSIKQQRFMGQVVAYKQGKLKKPSEEIKKAAMGMTLAEAKEFASTKEAGLPLRARKKSKVARRPGNTFTAYK